MSSTRIFWAAARYFSSPSSFSAPGPQAGRSGGTDSQIARVHVPRCGQEVKDLIPLPKHRLRHVVELAEPDALDAGPGNDADLQRAVGFLFGEDAILGNGEICAVLNPADLLRSAHSRPTLISIRTQPALSSLLSHLPASSAPLSASVQTDPVSIFR